MTRLTRRRFLAVTAAALGARPAAAATRWQGRALGAEASITLHGDPDAARTVLVWIEQALRDIEARFSLYDPGSELARLNARGRLNEVSPQMRDLLEKAGWIVQLTGGAFDPSVQPLWQALAMGGDVDAARGLIGWHRITLKGDSVTLDPGQALTLNGIAQGYATDRITALLHSAGFTRALVNIGEYGALGGPWKLGLDDPAQGYLGQLTLTSGAVATSSPGAMRLGEAYHILDPRGPGAVRPHWSTVSVEASSATLADGLSTALCLMDLEGAKQMRRDLSEVRRIVLVDHAGNLRTL